MRLQCPHCDETVEVTRFTTEGIPPRLRYECPACGKTVTETSDALDAAAPPEASAEKAPLDAKTSSPRVGDDVLWRAWDEVAEAFDDPAEHDAFLAACEASGNLAFAAARYREWADSHPEDEISPRRLKQVAALAQVKAFLTASKGTREEDPVRKAVLLGLVLLVFVLIALVVAPLVFRGMSDSQGGGGGGAMAPEPRLQNLRPRPPGMPPPPRRPRAHRPAPMPAPGSGAMPAPASMPASTPSPG